MTAKSSSLSPSRDDSASQEDVETVLPPTLFRLPDIASPAQAPLDAEHSVENKAIHEPAAGTTIPKPLSDFSGVATTEAKPVGADPTAAPLFEIRYDDAHAGPPRQHAAKLAVASQPEPPTASSRPTQERTSAPPAPMRAVVADSEPSPRTALEKYGSRFVVAAALVLIASATWLMGQNEGSKTDGSEFAGDPTSPTQSAPGPMSDDASFVASAASGEFRDGMLEADDVSNADIVTATLGKPEQETLTDNEDHGLSPSMDTTVAAAETATDPSGASASVALDSSPGMNTETVAAHKPQNNLQDDASESEAASPGSATDMLAQGPVPTEASMSDQASMSPESSLAPATVAQPMAAPVDQQSFPTTATPMGVTDWLKYLPQPGSNDVPTGSPPQPQPSEQASVPGQLAPQAAVTATPNDPYAAYQNYINGAAGSHPGGTQPAAAGSGEPRARTAANPYPNSNGLSQPTSIQPTSIR